LMSILTYLSLNMRFRVILIMTFKSKFTIE